MPELLVFHDVAFRYRRGEAHVLDGVHLSLGDGIVGLVGENGAGKTTLLQLALGALQPSQGVVRVRDQSPDAFRQRCGVGAMPDRPYFPAWLSVGLFLDGLRARRGNPPMTAAERRLAELFEIDALRARGLQELSLGQSRRVELCAAMIGDPDLLLFDEPTNGLDPVALAALRSGLLEARRPGRLLLVSSHHLDELQRIADRIAFLAHGRIAELTDGGESLSALESRFLLLRGARVA